MKNLILFVLFLIISFSQTALADLQNYNDPDNWGVQPKPKTNNKTPEAEEKVWKSEEEESIEENYGSQYSPSFLNRYEIDPDQNEWEYGGYAGD